MAKTAPPPLRKTGRSTMPRGRDNSNGFVGPKDRRRMPKDYGDRAFQAGLLAMVLAGIAWFGAATGACGDGLLLVVFLACNAVGAMAWVSGIAGLVKRDQSGIFASVGLLIGLLINGASVYAAWA